MKIEKCFGDILCGTSGGFDDVAILGDGIEDVAVNNDAHAKQHGIWSDLCWEDGGDNDAADAEKHDEMAGNHKRVVPAEHRALCLGCPPTGCPVIGGHPHDVAPHGKIGMVEGIGNEGGVEEED